MVQECRYDKTLLSFIIITTMLSMRFPRVRQSHSGCDGGQGDGGTGGGAGRGLVMHIREFLHTSGGLEQRLAAVSLYI